MKTKSSIPDRTFDKTFKYFKCVKQPQGILAIMHHEEKAQTNFEKAELFNKFFQSVFNNKSAEWVTPHTNDDPQNDLRLNLTRRNLAKTLRGLSSSKARGPDELPNLFLKNLAEALAPSLQIIFRTSICKCVYPERWKTSENILVFKAEDRTLVKKYRPISLLKKTIQKFLRKLFSMQFMRKYSRCYTV